MTSRTGHVAIVTDSAACLPPGILDALDVRVVPMTLVAEDHVWPDDAPGVGELMAREGAGSFTTAAPSPGAYLYVLETLGERPVVIVTVAATMSASFESASTAARYVDGRRVEVVDSGTAAGAQGLVVMAAARAAADGSPCHEVVAAARDVAERVRLVAVLGRMDALARSGRVPGIAALAGRTLGLRPVFELSRGRVKPRLPARSDAAAVARLVTECRDGSGSGRLHVAILGTGSPGIAEALCTAVRRLAKEVEVHLAPFGPVMMAHTGGDVSGLAWWWEPEDHSPTRAALRGEGAVGAEAAIVVRVEPPPDGRSPSSSSRAHREA